MLTQTVENGIYESRSHGDTWPASRHVYIEDNVVRLLHDDCYYIFSYSQFFDVNKLGKRIGNLPEGFTMRVSPK